MNNNTNDNNSKNAKVTHEKAQLSSLGEPLGSDIFSYKVTGTTRMVIPIKHSYIESLNRDKNGYGVTLTFPISMSAGDKMSEYLNKSIAELLFLEVEVPQFS